MMKARRFKMIVLNFTAISQNQTECLLSHKQSVVVVVLVIIDQYILSVCLGYKGVFVIWLDKKNNYLPLCCELCKNGDKNRRSKI